MFLNENLNRYNSRLKTRAESFDIFFLLIVFFYKNLDWMTLVSAVTLNLGRFLFSNLPVSGDTLVPCRNERTLVLRC